MDELFQDIEKQFGYTPSDYQKDILEKLETTDENIVIEALAGSGKTTTLIQVLYSLRKKGVKPGDVKVLAFNKKNAVELGERLADIDPTWSACASTVHSLGMTLLRDYLQGKPTIRKEKYGDIARDLGYLDPISGKSKKKGLVIKHRLCEKKVFLKLLSLVRLGTEEVTSDLIVELVEHHTLNIKDPVSIGEMIANCVKVGVAQAKGEFILDFDDLIYLPLFWNLTPRKKYKYILIDECQDLSVNRFELARLVSFDDTRFISCGDRQQSIYGWAGADTQSFNNIIKKTTSTVLDLPSCYRCPTSHLALVNKLYPKTKIQPAPDAPEGTITELEYFSLIPTLKEGDMVLSRKTSNLITICLDLIAEGHTKVTVEGSAIGLSIVKTLEKAAKQKDFTFVDLFDYLDSYYALHIKKWIRLDDGPERLKDLADQMKCIKLVYNMMESCPTIDHLKRQISSLFSDLRNSPYTLATIHRAKGREAERVFILEYGQFPFYRPSQPAWATKQEENLHYVALTRSKQDLFLVEEEPTFQDEKLEMKND